MRVLVCGGRDFTDTEFIYSTLDKFAKYNHIDCIIEGDARGVDRIAGYWARKNRIDLYRVAADWDRYRKAAGYIRNKQMLNEYHPDLVIAFPGGVGTAMMVKLAREAGVEVVEIDYERA
jgi:phosphomannomutase